MVKNKRSKPAPDSPQSYTKERREFEVSQERRKETFSRENRNFTQIYDRGWRKLNARIKNSPSTARFWVFLAEQMDTSGVVVATQETLARAMGVRSTKTIQRWSEALEISGSLVRIPMAGGMYAYALNPEEVWKAYDKDKEYAAFNRKTMRNATISEPVPIRRKVKVLLDEMGPAKKPKNIT